MPAHVMAQVRLPYVTDRPGDVSINTFHFFVPTGVALDAAAFTSMSERIIEFYTINFATWTLGEHIGEIVSRDTDACTITYYIAESVLVAGKVKFGDPVTVVHFSLPTATGLRVPLPLEVALVTSFVGIPRNMTDAPMLKRRRRGRFFIGPLTTSVIDATVDGVPNPTTATTNGLAGVTKRLADYNWATTDEAIDGLADGIPLWVVWSRGSQESTVTPAVADHTLEGACTAISNGWVDNEFDTQRRRQIPADDKTEWSV